MQFIIAPAKKMRVDTDSFATQSWPEYLSVAEQLLAKMRTLSAAEAQKLWQCSDKLAATNYSWLQQMDLHAHVTPAVMSYIGLQYQSMAPDLLTKAGLQYLAANLRILSGFYGVLRAFDAVVPYRLELGSRLQVGTAKNLYAFWDDRLYRALDFTQPVVNLASEEYAKAVRPYLQPDDQFITVHFVHRDRDKGQLKTRATYAKMARGAMVRYAAENQVQTVAALKAFDDPHYHFSEADSTDSELVFLHQDS